MLTIVSSILISICANAATVATPTLPSYLPTGTLDVSTLADLDANGWKVYNATGINSSNPNWYAKSGISTSTWTPTADVSIATPFTSVTQKTGASVVTLRSNRTVAYRIKNASKVSLAYARYSAHKVTLDARVITNGTAAAVGITDSKTESKDANNVAILTVELDNTKEYVVYAYSDNDGGNTYFYQLAFQYINSDTRTATAAPSISYESSTNSATVTIANNETTAAGNVYYTTDGSTPTASSTKYTTSFDLASACTVKAIFIPTDGTTYNESSVTSEKISIVEIQNYTSTTNYAFPQTAPDAGSVIVNKNIEVKTVYATTSNGVDQNYNSVQGRTYNYAINIRVNSIDASGAYTEKSGSTPLVITPMKNGTLQVLYRRQSDDAKTNKFTTGVGKDIQLSKAGTNVRLAGDAMAVFDTFNSNTDPTRNDAWYGHFVREWEVEAGQEYLLYASGTTIQMAGLRFFPDHTVSAFTPGTEGYSTMCLDYDAVIPTGVEAYKGTLSNNTLALTKLTDVIPAKTPVVLKGSSSVTFKKQLAVAESVGANDLKGNIAATATTSVTGGTVCVLGYEDEKAGFYQYTGANLGANKAYLVVPSSAAKGGLSIVFDDDNTTAVAGVAEAKASVKTVKFMKNGQLLIKTANGIINAAAAQVK